WVFGHRLDYRWLRENLPRSHVVHPDARPGVVATVETDGVRREGGEGVLVQTPVPRPKGIDGARTGRPKELKTWSDQARLLGAGEVPQVLPLARDHWKQRFAGLVDPFCVQMELHFLRGRLDEAYDLLEWTFAEACGEKRLDEE